MAQEFPVCQNLINTNFQTYRFYPNLKYEILSQSIVNNEKLQTLELDTNDYSYCQMSMANSINNLYYCPGQNDRVYYITNYGKIMTSIIRNNHSPERIVASKVLFQIPGTSIVFN